MVVMGGWGYKYNSDTIEIFDKSINQWHELDFKLPFSMSQIGIVQRIKKDIIIFDG